jgi:hypothetical protein
VADAAGEPVGLALACGTCQRKVVLSYTPGPRSLATTFFCPYCHKVNRLDVPGSIRGVTKAHDERF